MREAFEKTLDENCCDWTTRRIFADWLDENDQPDLAFAQRWMARDQIAPAYRVPYVGPKVTKPWAWYPPDYPFEIRAPRHARLPFPLFAAITQSQFPINHLFYRTRLQAEQDLARGLRALQTLLEV